MAEIEEKIVVKPFPKRDPTNSVEGWTIFIRGLHEEAREEDVKDKFADCGDITEFHMPLDRASGYVKGYGIMKFKKREAAEKAVTELNGTDWMDNKLTVDWAFLAD
jgi:RNA-binding protein 8A